MLLVYKCVYDSSSVIGVGSDMFGAEKIVKASAKKYQEVIKQVKEGKWKISNMNDGEDYHYWIETVQVDKLI
jgi:hypothetical protein